MNNKSNIELSIVIPLFNEEEIISKLYERITNVAFSICENYEIIFINDGSKDNTFGIIKDLSKKDNKIKFISFSRNFGHQNSILSGILNSKGNSVVIIDGDLQDPPELIPKLYAKMQEGYHVVYAKRKERKGESFLKKITAKMFYRILKNITSIDIPLDTGDFRIISRNVVESLKLMNEKNKFLRGQIAWLGYKQTYVEYIRDSRTTGETKFSYKKMFGFAFDGITSFSSLPLQLAPLLGFIFSIVSFFIILYALYSKFILHEVVQGWTSLLVSTMFIGGVQLLCVGIIGEYVSRINIEVKNRPNYIIEESNIENL